MFLIRLDNSSAKIVKKPKPRMNMDIILGNEAWSSLSLKKNLEYDDFAMLEEKFKKTSFRVIRMLYNPYSATGIYVVYMGIRKNLSPSTIILPRLYIEKFLKSLMVVFVIVLFIRFINQGVCPKWSFLYTDLLAYPQGQPQPVSSQAGLDNPAPADCYGQYTFFYLLGQTPIRVLDVSEYTY